MSYIVNNCPACIISPSCCAKYQIDNGHAKDCQDIKDCVIKQVIQACNEYSDKWEDCDFSNGLSGEILQLFDIEEVRE